MDVKQLIKIRKSKNLTQQKLADRAGISRSFYTKIEANNRRPSPRVAFRIGGVLGISKDKIIDIFFASEDYGEFPPGE